MSIYEQELNNLKSADVATLSTWIRDKAQTNSFTPLESEYASSRVDTASLIPALYNESDASTQQKLKDALDLLLVESSSQKNILVLSEVMHVIGRIDYEFPRQVLIQFIIDNASSTDRNIDEAKSDALDLLQAHLENSNEISHLFAEWYWSNPVIIGPIHAFQLFSGLVTINPSEFPKLLIRLNEINQTFPPEDQFETHWIWGIIVDNCTEEELQRGLLQLPKTLSDQLIALRQEDPDLFSCE